eukprot:858172-Pleurochrysis_carterae.AAC.1
MTEDICAGSPSMFSQTNQLGPFLSFDVAHRGVQRFFFTFPDTGVRIEWCALYVSPDERRDIPQLHLEAAHLLADCRLGVQDELATEARYLPIGWATLECHTRPPRPR